MIKKRIEMNIIDVSILLFPSVLWLQLLLLVFCGIISKSSYEKVSWLIPSAYMIVILIHFFFIYHWHGQTLGKHLYQAVVLKNQEVLNLKEVLIREVCKLIPFICFYFLNCWILLIIYLILQAIFILIQKKGIHDYLFHTNVSLKEETHV